MAEILCMQSKQARDVGSRQRGDMECHIDIVIVGTATKHQRVRREAQRTIKSQEVLECGHDTRRPFSSLVFMSSFPSKHNEAHKQAQSIACSTYAVQRCNISALTHLQSCLGV
jgi:hypothetical protein